MKNSYPSKYSNGKTVSAAQFITEIICEHKAKLDKEDLYYRFWTTKKWEKFYRNQISSANKLIKQYDPKVIIRALHDSAASKIYSLRAPHLVDIIQKYEKILESENTDFTLNIDRKTNKTYKKDIKKDNIISRIKEMEDGD